MTFDELYGLRDWRPLRNCPGRYVLHGARHDLTQAEVVGEVVEATEYRVAAARDDVLVVPLEGGGLISYRRADGSLLHTLNTAEGFERKLRQLGIIRR
jgi:hypothetical protein